MLPDAVIFRPSVMFGPEDGFYNKFAEMARFVPALPLVGGGHTRFQPVQVGDVASALLDLIAADTGPSVARYLARRATAEQAREYLVLRSISTLREADTHSWAIPRLTGRPKAAVQPHRSFVNTAECYARNAASMVARSTSAMVMPG